MRRRARQRFVSALVAAAMAVIAACTTFNGLSVPSESNNQDAATDVSVSDVAEEKSSPTIDAGSGFLDLEDAVRYCVNAFNCPNLALSTVESIDVPVDTQHFSSCVDWMAGPLPPDRVGAQKTALALDCAAKATTCEAAGNCMWFNLIDVSDPRCNGVDSGPLTDAGYDPGTCEGDGGFVLYCNAGYIEHCDNPYWAPGTQCVLGTNGVHNCDIKGACGSTDCTSTFINYCSVDGHHVSYDCAIGGFSCGTDSTNDTDCLTNGTFRGCSTVATTCAGDAVSVCDGAYQAAYDCAAVTGGTCDNTYTPRCKRPTDTCSPATPGIDTCTGDVISLCSGGQPTSFDCTSIGLKCLPAATGQSGHCG
jgi:hypothetical protein